MDRVKGVPYLLAEARTHGLTLRVDGERLTVRGPRASRGLARRILERKPEVLRALRGGTADPPSDAAGPPGEGEDPRTAWDRAFEAVARAWDARRARTAGTGDAPPWLDDVTQGHLLGRIHEAIVLGRDAAALEAIGAWRKAWDAVLGSPDGDDDGISSIVPGHRGEGGAGSPANPTSAATRPARSAGPRESDWVPRLRAEPGPAESDAAGRPGAPPATRPRSGSSSGLSSEPVGNEDFAGAIRRAHGRLREAVARGELADLSPFDLRPAVRVVDPAKFLRGLLRDLEHPGTPRARTGAAQADLRALCAQLDEEGRRW